MVSSASKTTTKYFIPSRFTFVNDYFSNDISFETYNSVYLSYVGDAIKRLKECFDNHKDVIMSPKKCGFYSELTILRVVEGHQGENWKPQQMRHENNRTVGDIDNHLTCYS